ncbi:MAG: M20/M25/M40 family metallo-hydrolase, partial [Pseudomonadota bacterium]|nr:M20/M25/M40 family metallo-hydrolase [Pseudomonadota bacterium]
MNPYEDLGRWIDAHHPEQIAFLREIVRVPSDTPPGDNAAAAEKAATLLAAMNFGVERHPVPEDFLRAYSMRSVTNLIVRQRFGSGGPTIALNAHGDVVPPGEGWTRPPYAGEIENGRMYGRGVAVSKSDIATYTYALAALRALAKNNGAVLNGT